MATILHSTGTNTVVYTPPPTAQRTPFAEWLTQEFIDHHCDDAVEFSRRYGFALSTVRAWLAGRRRPSMKKCEELAGMLDVLPLEVKAAAGHVTFQEIEDYTHAYANDDTDNWATTGDL